MWFPASGNAKWKPLPETVWQVLTKLNMVLPHDPASVLLSIYQKKLKTMSTQNLAHRLFIVALFIIAQNWKQPRCPSIGELQNKLQYVQIMENYSIVKWNDLSSQGETGRKLKSIVYCLVEEASLKSLHTIQFQLPGLPEKAKL